MPATVRSYALPPLSHVTVEQLPSVSQALDEWLSDIALKRSPQTVRTYRALLKLPDSPLTDLDRSVCSGFLASIAATRAVATTATTYGALSSFLKYCVLRGWLSLNPVAGIPCPTPQPGRQRVFTSDELARLWAAAIDDRDHLLLLLLTTGPIRVNELVHIRWQDCDLQAGTVRLLWAKGGHPRTLPMSDDLKLFLSSTVHSPFESELAPPRATLDSKPLSTVHATTSLLPMTTDGVRVRLKRLAKRARVPDCHPHAFRHTYSVAWMRETQDATTLKYLGGWRSDEMIEHYARTALEYSAVTKAQKVGLKLL